MHTYRYQAISTHNQGCLRNSLYNSYDNANDNGVELTAEQHAEEAASFLMEGITTCSCEDHTPWGFDPAKCLCGCGQDAKSNYLPGHDARHASYVARSYVESLEFYTSVTMDEALAVLPSEKLVRKAEAMILRLRAAKGL